MNAEKSHGLQVKTYRYPGRWMDGAELEGLRKGLRCLAERCLGAVPEYGVFLPHRAPYSNRIITVVRSSVTHEPVAFSAMVTWPLKGPDGRQQQVIHLGLVVVDPAFRGKMMMYWIYHRPLSRYFWMRFPRPFWVTSTTAEPVIFGSVADNFSRVFPHYRPGTAPAPDSVQRRIAKTFVAQHGHEIGLSPTAWLDAERFIIRDSSLGASRELMHSYDETAKYRIEACNQFCRAHLRYERGDEFIQVARVDLPAILQSAWWTVRKWKKKLGLPA